jgi:hypothetical protein
MEVIAQNDILNQLGQGCDGPLTDHGRHKFFPAAAAASPQNGQLPEAVLAAQKSGSSLRTALVLRQPQSRQRSSQE